MYAITISRSPSIVISSPGAYPRQGDVIGGLVNQTRKAFTLIELLVVIAIIAILAAILVPVFAQAKDAAKKTQSLSNVKQQVTSHLLYSSDFDDLFSPLAHEKQTDTIDYDSSFIPLLLPYTKSLRLFYSPNSKDQSDPKLTASPRTSGGVLTQYAMLPRWQVYAGTDASNALWRTAYAPNGALMEGIAGYSFDEGAAYFGNNNYCTNNGGAEGSRVGSLGQTSVARVSETALVLEARGWDYGFFCRSPWPSPADAIDDTSPTYGINFDGRYTFRGEQRVNNLVRYRIGVGAVGFADGHAKTMETGKFYETIDVAGGQKAYRYQYAKE